MMKLTGMILVAIGAAGSLVALAPAPEIDPATGGNALALLAGALLIVRSRRR
ncbi:MAG: VPEID-CTERM sorting domain-containing protein [Acidobacteriia bacterium]|nr:VPEID-CTERM sorting domain-containing protein [Terriglobia bacterium]